MARLFVNEPEENKERAQTSVRSERPTIFVAFEGSKVEPQYFSSLIVFLRDNGILDKNVRILDRNRKDGHSHPENVRDGVIEFFKENPRKYREGDEVWIVIDLDEHFNIGGKFSKEKFDQFMTTLETEKGMKINLALSNPCFELWLLLHYANVQQLDLKKIELQKEETPSCYCKRLYREKHHSRPGEPAQFVFNAISNSSNNILPQENNEVCVHFGSSVVRLVERLVKKKQ